MKILLHTQYFKHNAVVDVAKGIAIGAGGLGLNSLSGKIEHSAATTAMFLRCCVVQALIRGDGSATRYTLRRNTAIIMKI